MDKYYFQQKAEEITAKMTTEEQAEQLKSTLANPEKTREILNSPAAQALMKKLMK